MFIWSIHALNKHLFVYAPCCFIVTQNTKVYTAKSQLSLWKHLSFYLNLISLCISLHKAGIFFVEFIISVFFFFLTIISCFEIYFNFKTLLKLVARVDHDVECCHKTTSRGGQRPQLSAVAGLAYVKLIRSAAIRPTDRQTDVQNIVSSPHWKAISI